MNNRTPQEDILTIGAFQLANLIQSRVPFIFVRGNFEIESKFGVMEKIHIRNFSIVLNEFNLQAVMPLLDERKARHEDPIVILDQDGTESFKLSVELTAKGYKNVIYIPGGWQAILNELPV